MMHPRWKVILFLTVFLGALVGVTAGVGGYTFIYAQGASYLMNDPAACKNCHIMNEQYDGWLKASHHAVATCNDCHTPHNFIGKYTTKAINGWNHSFAFTTGRFHEPIQINERNRRITENACRDCHKPIVENIGAGEEFHRDWGSISCISCHDSVGHMH